MKVYISFDIEGVSGITDTVDIDTNSAQFMRARRLSTSDVNAAIEGALEAGATDILVYDSHGRNRRNLLYEDLHPKAKFLQGRFSSVGLNMPGFDQTYDAVFFVGWHARASAPGILSHCLNSRVFTAWRVNGTPVGEPELAAAVAGYHGVPLVLFTGDDCACNEVKSWCPGCERVVTKHALDRYSAVCLSKEETGHRIREGAITALKRRSEIPPFRFREPIRVEADTFFDHAAAAMSLIPTLERKSLLTVGFESNDYLQAYRTIHVMQLLSAISE